MDQLKVFLANVKKYHFWILCSVVVVIGLIGWYLATGSLDSQSKTNVATIKSKDSEITNVGKIDQHPNPDFLTGMDKLIEDYSRSTAKGWRRRYAQQKALLVWPKRLGPDFNQQVNHLRPIEEHVAFDETKGYDPATEIPVRYREMYRNFITLELPTLAERIGAKWTAKVGESSSGASSAGGSSKSAYSSRSSGGPGAGRGMGAMRGKGAGSNSEEEEEDDSIVYWDAANQQEILDQHFMFASEQKTPHTLDVLYAQEDLWVLEAIINVIQRTNGDADANYNAAIKEIESLKMGRTVGGRIGKVTSLLDAAGSTGGGMGSAGAMGSAGSAGAGAMGSAGASGSAGAGGMPPGGPMGPGGAMGSGGAMGPGGAMGSGGAMGGSGPVDPAFGRYVDVNYNPLPPKELRAARDATTAETDSAIYSVAKRMPVRMRLRMDQRKLNDLLAECGNSSLPIEVRQVRINCDADVVNDSDGSAGGSNSMGGGSMGGGASKSSSRSGSKSGGSGRSQRGPGASKGGMAAGGMGGGSGSSSEEQQDPNEIVVDVYGIVHIYNPLNEKQLNTNLREEGEVPAVPTSPTAVSPVATPPRS